MRRDFTQVLNNLDGTPAHDSEGKPVTLLSVSLQALLAMDPNEKVPAEHKAKCFQLAQKINARPAKTDITIEELARVKECVGKFFGPLVVGRAFELLEQEPALAVDNAKPE